MTFKERLAIEHPENIDDTYNGGCIGCPKDYGYSEDIYLTCGKHGVVRDCEYCWNRKIPVDDFGHGSKVRLRDGLLVGMEYDGIRFLREMYFDGEKKVRYISDQGNYRIGRFYYSPVMLRKAGESEEKKMKFKVGDRVRTLKGPNDLSFTIFPAGTVGTVTKIEGTDCNIRVSSEGMHWWYPEDVLEKVEFSIEDLEDGNMIKTRNGNIFLWLLGRPRSLNYSLDHMKNNLKNGIKEDFDIIEVRDASNLIFTGIKDLFNNYKNLTIIWKEEELPKTKDVSLDEINALLKEKYPDIDKFNLPIEKED